MRILLLCLLCLSCQQDKQNNTAESKKAAGDAVAIRHNPYSIVFNVGEAVVEAKFPESTHIVPKVNIEYSGTVPVSYYEVQRCEAGTDIEDDDDNDPLTDSFGENTIAAINNHLYAWGKATVTAGTCVTIGGLHKEKTFIDLTADTGDYFYLIRPCLSVAQSQYENRRTCHYLFRKTNAVQFEDTLAINKYKQKMRMGQLRTSLQHVFSRIGRLVRHKADILEICDFNETNKAAFKAKIAGIAKVAITASVAVTAALVSGGTAAFVAGSAAIQLGDKLFAGMSDYKPSCTTPEQDKQLEELYVEADLLVTAIATVRSELEGIEFSRETNIDPNAQTTAPTFDAEGNLIIPN